MNKTIFTNPIFNMAVIIGCIFVSTIIVMDNDVVYSSIALLPIAYMMIHILSQIITPREAYRNLGYVLYFAQSIMKCVIAPLFLCISNYTSLFEGLNGSYIFNAVLLMIYEHFVCTIVIAKTMRKKRTVYGAYKRNITTRMALSSLVAMFAFLMVFMWVLAPDIQNNFVTIFEMASSQEIFTGSDYTSTNAVGTISRIVTTLFLVLFKSFRIVFPFYIIKVLSEKYNNFSSFLISIIIVALQFLFVSETVAMAVIVAFMLLSYMLRVYPQYKRSIVVVMSASVAVAAFILSLNFEYMSRWFGVNNIQEYISQIMQSYIPGVCNTASIFRVESTSRVSTLIDTLISTIPFQNTLFGSISWDNDLNTLYTSTYGLGGQIVSTIAGRWYIFGYLLAPVFSAIFVKISMLYGYKYPQADNDIQRLLYLFMCIQTMLGVGMYNIQTTITLWIQVGLVLKVCSKLSAERNFAGGVSKCNIPLFIAKYINSFGKVYQTFLLQKSLVYGENHRRCLV